MWKTVGYIVNGLFFLLLAVASVLLLVDRIARFRFTRRHIGTSFLVCSPRRGWYEFIINNVAPVLPEGILLHWTDPDKREPSRTFFDPHQALTEYREKRPFLAKLGTWRVKAIPLHDALLPLKGTAHRDAEVQTQVAEILKRGKRTT